MSAVSSQVIRDPESDVSATSARYSRLKSSTMANTRNLRRSVKASETKSWLQRSLGLSGTNIGLRVPRARFRPPRVFTCSFSSAESRLSFFWFTYQP